MDPQIAHGEDDELIDRMIDDVPPASAQEAAAREPYEELFALIREYRDPPAPPGWEERLDVRWAAARQRRRRAAIVVAAVIAVMLGAWLLSR